MNKFVKLYVGGSEKIVNLDNISVLERKYDDNSCNALVGNEWVNINKPYNIVEQMLMGTASCKRPAVEAIPFSNFSNEDLAAELFRRYGFAYVAVDPDDTVLFFKDKPVSERGRWTKATAWDAKTIIKDIFQITKRDEQPLYIGNGDGE